MNKIILQEHELQVKLQTLSNSLEPIYILFFSSKKDDGVRWCPDCVDAEAVLLEAEKSAAAGTVLLQVDITYPHWKQSPGKDHEFRKAPFNVAGIPTLVKFDPKENKVLQTITDAECQQLELVTALFRNDQV